MYLSFPRSKLTVFPGTLLHDRRQLESVKWTVAPPLSPSVRRPFCSSAWLGRFSAVASALFPRKRRRSVCWWKEQAVRQPCRQSSWLHSWSSLTASPPPIIQTIGSLVSHLYVYIRDIQRLPTTLFPLVLRKKYFDCPERDSYTVH